MQKILTSVLSLVLVPAVLLSATHAKDLVPELGAMRVLGAAHIKAMPSRSNDPMAKSISDLHHHSDNNMVKHILKSSSDTQNQAVRRDHEEIADANPISTRIMEFSIKVRLLFAYGLNIVRLGA